MKHLPLLFSFLLLQCVAPLELSQEDREKIFEHNIQLPAKDIKLKIHTFVNESFGSGKAVIQSNEDGLITGNFIFECDEFDIMLGQRTFANCTFLIKYSDNNYRMKLVVKNIFKQDDNRDYEVHESYWGNYAEQIRNYYSYFDDKLINYINSKDTF